MILRNTFYIIAAIRATFLALGGSLEIKHNDQVFRIELDVTFEGISESGAWFKFYFSSDQALNDEVWEKLTHIFSEIIDESEEQ
jgi:hypothetical protein